MQNVFAEAVEVDPDFEPPIIPKEEEEKMEIRRIFESNILFSVNKNRSVF